MSRYHFHVADGEEYPDLLGTELNDLAAARREAVRFAGALLAEAPERFWNAEEWSMRVTNDTDMTLFTLMFLATSAPAARALSSMRPV